MRVIGLTGGIGSGKTTVAKMFKAFGVPIYIADTEAKKLMNQSAVIKRKLTQLLGSEAYKDGTLNRQFVANKVFANQDLLNEVNQIVHPRVQGHFNKWVAKQKGFYCIKEAAVLFENGGYKLCDKNILITAPESIRINRIQSRDQSNLEAIKARIDSQWRDDEKIPLADFVIENINLEETKKQVEDIHYLLLREDSY